MSLSFFLYVKPAGYAYIHTYVFFRQGVKAYVKPTIHLSHFVEPIFEPFPLVSELLHALVSAADPQEISFSQQKKKEVSFCVAPKAPMKARSARLIESIDLRSSSERRY